MSVKVPITQEHWEKAYDLAYSEKMTDVITGELGMVAVLGMCMAFIQICASLGVNASSTFAEVYSQTKDEKASAAIVNPEDVN